jgi:CRISPR-associated protein Cas2
MSTLYVVAYDTPSDRRRRKLAKLLEGYGHRVQDSVYECWLLPHQRNRLVARLRAAMHPACDKIRMYPLCGKDVADVLCCGLGGPPRDADVPVL